MDGHQRDQSGQQLLLPLDLPGVPPGRRVLRSAGVILGFALRWAVRIGLPLLGGAIALQAFAYRATVQGVPFTVRATLLHQTGLSADTTVGSWVFPAVDGLPVGVHVTPRDVDLVALTRAASGNTPEFVRRLRDDAAALVPHLLLQLAGVFLLGVALGLLAAAAVDMSIRYLRGLPRRPRELRRRARQVGASIAVLVVIGGYGALTYNPSWAQQSRLTGTLAAAQLFPDQLRQYYTQQNKALDVLASVTGIQAALQDQIGADDRPATALRIMFVSDMHLAPNYGLVAQYADNYDVDLVVDSGDESEFGTAMELTPGYLDQLRALTTRVPMLWLAGNHDSPQVEATMRTIPGVTVLGSKTVVDDGLQVSADVVDAYGLTIAGLPDPRVYGGSGAYGADDATVTDPLERRSVDLALGPRRPSGASASASSSSAPSASSAPSSAPSSASAGASSRQVDLFATHEPVAAAELRKVLGDRVRETVSGHVHAQNDPGDLQNGSAIDLVEGSTGAGGLDNIGRGDRRPPIEFSIELVGADCQFTRIVRFQIRTPPTGDAGTLQAYGDDVTSASVSFRPQGVAEGRTCGTALGLGQVRPW